LEPRKNKEEKWMQKILFYILVLVFIPAPIFAEEQPIPVREGSNSEASQHHTQGIESFNQGNYEEAYKHFREVLKIAPSAEGYFNGALSLHKWGYPKEAANFFYYAKKYANGNVNILQSNLANQLPVQPKPKRRAPVPQAPFRSEGS
jgi:tetratricopeptide (TPR) repeat protein